MASGMMHKNRSVDVHQFAMVPKAEIPRSSFRMQSTHKTTFDAGYLIPVYVQEVLPGDSFDLKMTAFCRLATPLFPLMDNLYLESFFFFVPNRLVWSNWRKFMGEQANPADSISYTVPQMTGRTNGYVAGTLQDYFGLPTGGALVQAGAWSHGSLPLRAYNLIYNEWFRDENLQNSVTVDLGDGPDTYTNYVLKRRGKRHDYFTGCLPWTQKATSAVTLPLGTSAIVRTAASENVSGAQTAMMLKRASDGTHVAGLLKSSSGGTLDSQAGVAASVDSYYPSNLYADLSTATAATINQIRQSFQIQKLLERDARGGTRYTEIVRSHFGVVSPDARLQRPEYLGGGSTPIMVTPIAQTSATAITGSTTAFGSLAAVATGLAQGHGFRQAFTEHGHVIGLVNVRADLTYQQGIRKMWLRSTRYDFYFPVFAMLGEQAVQNQEICFQATAADTQTFGYQERWAEYRYHPSMITGYFKSQYATPLDGWHLAQYFSVLPTLNDTFISDTPPVSRVVAAGTGANGAQFLFDSFFDVRAARPMPLYSVPGMIDHF